MKKLTGYQMQELPEGLTKADFHGFTLQAGFWFGKNLRGQYIATSTWIAYNAVAIYVKSEAGWKMQWHDINAWYLPKELKELFQMQLEDAELFDCFDC